MTSPHAPPLATCLAVLAAGFLGACDLTPPADAGPASTGSPSPPPGSVEISPGNTLTNFAGRSDGVVKIEFTGADPFVNQIDWYPVAGSVRASVDGTPIVPREVVPLVPVDHDLPVPQGYQYRDSQFGQGVPGHQTSGQAGVASVVVAFDLDTLQTGDFVTIELDLPKGFDKRYGFDDGPPGLHVQTTLGLKSQPTVYQAALLIGGADGGASSKAATRLSEAVPIDLLLRRVSASVDGVPCALPGPTPPADAWAGMWSLGCPRAGSEVTFRIDGPGPGEPTLHYVDHGTIVPAPYEVTKPIGPDDLAVSLLPD
jgi:hypothetical protein